MRDQHEYGYGRNRSNSERNAGQYNQQDNSTLYTSNYFKDPYSHFYDDNERQGNRNVHGYGGYSSDSIRSNRYGNESSRNDNRGYSSYGNENRNSPNYGYSSYGNESRPSSRQQGAGYGSSYYGNSHQPDFGARSSERTHEDYDSLGYGHGYGTARSGSYLDSGSWNNSYNQPGRTSSRNQGSSSGNTYGSGRSEQNYGQGGYNRNQGSSYGSSGQQGNTFSGNYNQSSYNDGYAHGRRREDMNRDFFDRAGDEVRSWFGDDEAERRRRMDERNAPDRGWGNEHNSGYSGNTYYGPPYGPNTGSDF